MRVCADCLRTINDHEGRQIVKKIYVDERDPRESRCDFCEETGFDVLYEIYEEKRFNDSKQVDPEELREIITKEELQSTINALYRIHHYYAQAFMAGEKGPGSFYVEIRKSDKGTFYGNVFIDDEPYYNCYGMRTIGDAARAIAKYLQKLLQYL